MDVYARFGGTPWRDGVLSRHVRIFVCGCLDVMGEDVHRMAKSKNPMVAMPPLDMHGLLYTSDAADHLPCADPRWPCITTI